MEKIMLMRLFVLEASVSDKSLAIKRLAHVTSQLSAHINQLRKAQSKSGTEQAGKSKLEKASWKKQGCSQKGTTTRLVGERVDRGRRRELMNETMPWTLIYVIDRACRPGTKMGRWDLASLYSVLVLSLAVSPTERSPIHSRLTGERLVR